MYWEMKKILSRKITWAGICFLVIYAIYWFSFHVNGYDEHAVTDTGDVIVGKEAILMNQKAAEKYKGSITDEKLDNYGMNIKINRWGLKKMEWK